jgi:hypothetical protein
MNEIAAEPFDLQIEADQTRVQKVETIRVFVGQRTAEYIESRTLIADIIQRLDEGDVITAASAVARVIHTHPWLGIGLTRARNSFAKHAQRELNHSDGWENDLFWIDEGEAGLAYLSLIDAELAHDEPKRRDAISRLSTFMQTKPERLLGAAKQVYYSIHGQLWYHFPLHCADVLIGQAKDAGLSIADVRDVFKSLKGAGRLAENEIDLVRRFWFLTGDLQSAETQFQERRAIGAKLYQSPPLTVPIAGTAATPRFDRANRTFTYGDAEPYRIRANAKPRLTVLAALQDGGFSGLIPVHGLTISQVQDAADRLNGEFEERGWKCKIKTSGWDDDTAAVEFVP